METMAHGVMSDVFMRHPILGAIISLTTPILGYLMPYLIEAHIPVIYMQIIQISVWSIGGIVGILTIRGLLKKKPDGKG